MSYCREMTSTDNSFQVQLNALAEEFWRWRASQQPRSHDDIPRIERPQEWIPQWSAADLVRYRAEIANFEEKLAEIAAKKVDASIDDLIDLELLKSACARVHWELDYLQMPRRFPRFYIDQTIGAVFDYLLEPTITSSAIGNVRRLLKNFASILADAKANLANHAYREFAEVSISDLASIEQQLPEMARELLHVVPTAEHITFQNEISEATQQLVAYREWLQNNLPHFQSAQPVGREKFEWFLAHVALVPYSVEELLQIGEVEFDRATYLESLYINRFANIPLPALPESAVAQSRNEGLLEQSVRDFYERENLLTQPATLRHYLNAPLPRYLLPIRWLGVTDDLTGPSRLDQDGISYVPDPRPDMPYFYAANARDPRAGIVHEGAHYQQLALAWKNPRPIRRRYYDSGVNEGVAFYNEEMLLAAGLFSDAPHSQSLMYNFMKLRALRVIIDVSLVTGRMSIKEATDYLSKKVPMDHATAHEEAVFFASFPGQGMTYQIGKTQIISLLADARRSQQEKFSLRHFHDYLWVNGNVPVSLLRWGYLNDPSQFDQAVNQDNERAKSEIWANVRQMLDCFLNKDRVNADRHIHDDVTLWDSVEEPLIFGLKGLNALRDRRPNTPGGPTVTAIDNVNPTIDVFGDFAIARYELFVHFSDATPTEHIRNSAVWRRFPSGWKVIHNHEDVIS